MAGGWRPAGRSSPSSACSGGGRGGALAFRYWVHTVDAATSRSARSTPASTGCPPTSTCSSRAWPWRSCSSGPAGATSRCACSTGPAATRWSAGWARPPASGRCRPARARLRGGRDRPGARRWSRRCSYAGVGFLLVLPVALAGADAAPVAALAGQPSDGRPGGAVVRHLPLARGGDSTSTATSSTCPVFTGSLPGGTGGHPGRQRGGARPCPTSCRAAGPDAQGPPPPPVRPAGGPSACPATTASDRDGDRGPTTVTDDRGLDDEARRRSDRDRVRRTRPRRGRPDGDPDGPGRRPGSGDARGRRARVRGLARPPPLGWSPRSSWASSSPPPPRRVPGPGRPDGGGVHDRVPRAAAPGDIPNRDFLHLYGPGSIWTIAGFFKVFGVSMWTERVVGLLQLRRLLIVGHRPSRLPLGPLHRRPVRARSRPSSSSRPSA